MPAIIPALEAAWSFLTDNIRTIAICIGIGAVCFLLGRCDGARDERARLEAAQARATIQATHAADEADQALRGASEARKQDIEGAIRNAVTEHPREAGESAGPGSSAVLDELRRRRPR